MNELPEALRTWLSAEPARVVSRRPCGTVTLIDFRDGTKASRRERSYPTIASACAAAARDTRHASERKAEPFRLLGEGVTDLSAAPTAVACAAR
jgi:hypothetical protein